MPIFQCIHDTPKDLPRLVLQIGNAWIDDVTGLRGRYEYHWAHALISDETIAGIRQNCDFSRIGVSAQCYLYLSQADAEIGLIDIQNIYAPLCSSSPPKSGHTASVSLH
jgi:serine carboxypeptidase-like clade 2